MRLEDAFLCVWGGRDATPEWSRAAIAGGADMLVIAVDGADAGALRAVGDVCRAEEALFVLSGGFEQIDELGADGVHLESAEGPVGQARAVVGLDRLVGVSVAGLDEARLAMAIGVDFVLLDAAVGAAVMRAVRAEAAVPVFAAGVRDADAGREAVEAGIYRLCVHEDSLGVGDVTEAVATYSRLLGRSI